MPKTILITGASSGLGKLAALGLARKGHDVIATAQIWPQVTELKDAASAEGVDMRVEKLDVTSVRDRETAFGWEIDVLVNNAGVMEAGPIAEQPGELLRAMFEVNFFGGLEVIQGFARQFAHKRRGKIVIMSSVAGLTTAPFAAGYCATKHALEAVAEALKMELAPFGIKVATINPGAYGTGFNDRGGDSMRWYDPARNFTPPDSFAGLRDAWEHQLDPQDSADVIVDVVLDDNAKFRNVHPREAVEFVKQSQHDAWAAVS